MSLKENECYCMMVTLAKSKHMGEFALTSNINAKVISETPLSNVS